ncbi:hypothetical protein VFPPC_18286 [Pochonia chlamydosporia 170]|uniref:Uncharacterized protein n=1 Tax=Pochonia chlamydosporia 170 TaxID=1380566 RepID=A0A219ANY7_METCM|nr:hypothetical protein VFPPC_18286 [Pochonia chlamydosporia 170]OWT42547.1 hypothetical protein VFPPC_18286 [Pochonia chlamydosporia 170]
MRPSQKTSSCVIPVLSRSEVGGGLLSLLAPTYQPAKSRFSKMARTKQQAWKTKGGEGAWFSEHEQRQNAAKIPTNPPTMQTDAEVPNPEKFNPNKGDDYPLDQEKSTAPYGIVTRKKKALELANARAESAKHSH